jgi:hypothetical protein
LRKPGVDHGFALAELLLIVSLLGLAGVASITTVRSSAVRSQRAQLTGARASVVFAVLDQLNAGIVEPDTGVINATWGGSEFEVRLVARDSILAGAVEIRIATRGVGPDLVLEAPRLAP